jgi:hypothetical protein
MQSTVEQALKARTAPDKPAVPSLAIPAPDLGHYDALLSASFCAVGGAA